MRRHTLNPEALVAAALGTTLLLAACSTATTGSDDATGTTGAPTPPPASSSSPNKPDTLAYGTASSDPIATTVSAPEPFTTSTTAMPQRLAGKPAFKVKITFENTTSKPVNPATLQFQATTGGQVVEKVQDSSNVAPGILMIGDIPPGATGSGWTAFAGQPDQSTRVIVSAMLGNKSTTFAHQ
ncbi:hypothetical protein FHX42_005323 [Saccharopolyspora lacisalsi]|uniref:DUF4352 domain-containing protein n=1 Tax=Halosaccharopolyspora lacisalsi TaxID=1000566 RepID=A0A839E5K6_9PSEU|nr:hypothetical protein [Halosaccharopolyspora lacisalsi]MBA8827882.1 hypothetical protein [Halosaccharopolyspora lacisalsi]MBA8827916.1 hypothetical protein [Halosaccharopolyspora lacisalsi]